MTSTEKKLKEARFFLSHLSKNKISNRKFSYYLNAFVGSARSVFWIMRHEFTHVEGWKKWYDSVKEGKNEVMLNFFKELRNTSVKKDPLDTYHEIEVIIPRELTNDLKATLDSILGKSGTLILATANETIPELEGIEYVFSKVSSISVKRQVKGRSTDKDIVVACTEYYNFLKSTVRDCLSRFENKLQSKSNT